MAAPAREVATKGPERAVAMSYVERHMTPVFADALGTPANHRAARAEQCGRVALPVWSHPFEFLHELCDAIWELYEVDLVTQLRSELQNDPPAAHNPNLEEPPFNDDIPF